MARTATMVLGVVLAVVVGMVFFPAVTNAVDTSTGTQTVTNETITAQYDEAVDLGGYNLKDGTVVVYGYNDTADAYETAVEGTDYEVTLQEGSVTALNGSTLIEDGEEVKVSYDYQATDGTTTLIIGFVPLMIGVMLFAHVATKTQDML